MPLVTWNAFTTDPSACATLSEVQLIQNISLVTNSEVNMPTLFTITENADTSGTVDISTMIDRANGGTVTNPFIYSVKIMV